jgi:galactose mutarotase-like enzyme
VLHDGLFEAGALVFDILHSRRVRYAGPHGSQIEVGFPHMPHLGVWTKPGAPFLCIEPWHGYAAPVGFAGELRQKLGIIELAPGYISEFGMTVTLRA